MACNINKVYKFNVANNQNSPMHSVHLYNQLIKYLGI